MVLGFELAVKKLPGLLLDAPSADAVLKKILKHCHEAGCWLKEETEEMSNELQKFLGVLKIAKGNEVDCFFYIYI